MQVKMSQVALCISLLAVAFLLSGCCTGLSGGDSGRACSEAFKDKNGKDVSVTSIHSCGSIVSTRYDCAPSQHDLPKKDGYVRQYQTIEYTGPKPLKCPYPGSYVIEKTKEQAAGEALPGECKNGTVKDYQTCEEYCGKGRAPEKKKNVPCIAAPMDEYGMRDVGWCCHSDTDEKEGHKEETEKATLYQVGDKVRLGVATTTSVPFVMFAAMALGLAGFALLALRFFASRAVTPSDDMELDSRLDVE